MKKMSTLGIIGLGFLGLILIMFMWGIGIYNNLVSLNQNVESQYSNVDVQLERRSNLIPNIVNTVKGYTSHESEILNQISESRTKLAGASTMSEKAAADSELNSSLSKLMLIVENYPDLKADTQFSALMDNLEGTENRIATARKDYNTAVQNYNKGIKTFPNILISSMLVFTTAELFQASESASQVPQVSFS